MNKVQLLEEPDPGKIEERFISGLHLYQEAGIQPGSFLMAVLQNDLTEAIKRADVHSQNNLKHIVAYLSEYFPATIWGSEKKVHEHIRERHLSKE